MTAAPDTGDRARHLAALGKLRTRPERVAYACEVLSGAGQPYQTADLMRWLRDHGDDVSDGQRGKVSTARKRWCKSNGIDPADTGTMPALTPDRLAELDAAHPVSPAPAARPRPLYAVPPPPASRTRTRVADPAGTPPTDPAGTPAPAVPVPAAVPGDGVPGVPEAPADPTPAVPVDPPAAEAPSVAEGTGTPDLTSENNGVPGVPEAPATDPVPVPSPPAAPTVPVPAEAAPAVPDAVPADRVQVAELPSLAAESAAPAIPQARAVAPEAPAVPTPRPAAPEATPDPTDRPAPAGTDEATDDTKVQHRRAVGTVLFYLGALACLTVSVNTSWEFFGKELGVKNVFERAIMFGVVELLLIACGWAMRAAARRDDGKGLGPARYLAWALCGVQAYMAFVLSGPVLGVARVVLGSVLGLVALHMALGIEIRTHRAARAGTWSRVVAEYRERLLSRIGLGDEHRDALTRTRERAVDRAARLANLRPRWYRPLRGYRLGRALRIADVSGHDAASRARCDRMLAKLSTLRHRDDLHAIELPSPWVRD